MFRSLTGAKPQDSAHKALVLKGKKSRSRFQLLTPASLFLASAGSWFDLLVVVVTDCRGPPVVSQLTWVLKSYCLCCATSFSFVLNVRGLQTFRHCYCYYYYYYRYHYYCHHRHYYYYLFTYSLTYLHTHSLTHSFTHSFTYSVTHLLTCLLTHSLTQSLIYSLTHLLTD